MPRGASLSLEQCWRLAQAWYSEPRSQPTWRRRTAEETRAVFEELGLRDDFWHV